MQLPDHIRNENELDKILSRPTPDLVKMMKGLSGDIMILGAAGKMGVTLGLMAIRAIREAGLKRKVIAVDRFIDEKARDILMDHGVEIIRCDLLNRSEVSTLPLVPNVIYMAGRKFGTDQDQELSWAINVLAPGYVADHFKKSRIVVFSTGCVYPLVTPSRGGCTEEEPPAPVGEYAQSCLGRERVFSYYSKISGTRICIFRLNYAIDLRYGVLCDIGVSVYASRPVALSASHFNCIWQGDANRMALLCLDHCSNPPAILNITGAETISTRETAEKFAKHFGRRVSFSKTDVESKMYLSDSSTAMKLFGHPMVTANKMIDWQAGWLAGGGRILDKPTHFEITNGQF